MKFINLVFLLILFSCSTPNSNQSVLKDYISKFHIENPQKVMLLYLDGCSGCYTQHREVIQLALMKNDYHVIVVTKSKKKADLILGETLTSSVEFDLQLTALELGLLSGFPIIYLFDEYGKQDGTYEVDYGKRPLSLP